MTETTAWMSFRAPSNTHIGFHVNQTERVELESQPMQQLSYQSFSI